MAELKREGEDLVLSLSAAEKVEAVHGDIRVPMSSVQSVEVVEDAVHAVNAFIKSVGSAWPGRFVIGTFHSGGTKSFAVVHHDTQRGVRVTLSGANFDELLVGCKDPEEVARLLGTQGPGSAASAPDRHAGRGHGGHERPGGGDGGRLARSGGDGRLCSRPGAASRRRCSGAGNGGGPPRPWPPTSGTPDRWNGPRSGR